jgi:isoleucyl-tRNA synthetase
MVVTEEGKKMSKSLGNDIPPGRVIKDSGAEILRLWVASVDFREEVRFGPEIIARVVEAYRKFRNTLRILAANLADRDRAFDPAVDAVPDERMLEVDRFALARYAEVADRIRKAYEAYDFPAIFQAVNAFLTVDMSAFYVDVSKDRLYTLAPGALPRRSAQTAMFRIADGLARLLAPVLPVLAEDFWRQLPGEREASVHLATFGADDGRAVDADLVERWQRLLKVRAAVNGELEKLRQAKTIGQSLEARVTLLGSGPLLDLLRRHQADLPMLFIVSETEVAAESDTQASQHGDAAVWAESEDSVVRISVSKAAGTRCDRCWRYVPSVSSTPGREGICPRCEDALAGHAS